MDRSSRGNLAEDPEILFKLGYPFSPVPLHSPFATAEPTLAGDSSPGVRDAAEITQRIATFARDPNGALVVLPSPVTIRHRETIIVAAARHRLPTIYPYRFFTVDGGLMSYQSDVLDSYRRAASYVDRILRGAKVAELPVQQPIKYELTINVQTAKSLGLALPDSVLARADEVIE